MPKKTERKNTNRGRSASPISDKLSKKKQNTLQTSDNDLSLTYVKEPLVTVLPAETNTMEVDLVEESSSNNLNKGKGPETLISTSTTYDTGATKRKASVIGYL